MKVDLIVALSSGAELRQGEIDRIIEAVDAAVRQADPMVDVYVGVSCLIPGPASVDTQSSPVVR